MVRNVYCGAYFIHVETCCVICVLSATSLETFSDNEEPHRKIVCFVLLPFRKHPELCKMTAGLFFIRLKVEITDKTLSLFFSDAKKT